MMPNLTPAKTRQTGKWTYFMSNFCSTLDQREQNVYIKVNIGTVYNYLKVRVDILTDTFKAGLYECLCVCVIM